MKRKALFRLFYLTSSCWGSRALLIAPAQLHQRPQGYGNFSCGSSEPLALVIPLFLRGVGVLRRYCFSGAKTAEQWLATTRQTNRLVNFFFSVRYRQRVNRASSSNLACGKRSRPSAHRSLRQFEGHLVPASIPNV